MPASGSTGSARAGGSGSPCSMQNSAILRASPLGGLRGFGDATSLGDKTGNVGARSQKAAGGQLLDAGADGGLVHRPCGLDAPRRDGMPQPRRRRYGDACAVTVIRGVRCEPR